jgi:cobalt-zinc-cadmium efflux system outer membrane protein
MNIIRKIKHFALVMILLSGFEAFSQDYLEKYLMEAASNNPGLKSAFNEYLAALEKIPQVGALPDPKVTFGYFIQPVETRLGPQQARISLMQMLPWFGTLDARKNTATEMAKSKYEMFEEAKSRLFYDVKSVYYNLYFTGQAIDITLENIDILNTFLNIALVKVESGLTSAVDLLRVEMEISDLENQLALLKDRSYAQQVTFNNLLNVNENREVSLPELLTVSELPYNRATVLDSIRSGNHQLRHLSFLESSFIYQEKAASKTGNPDISLGIDYMVIGKSQASMATSSESGTDAIVFPMVSISVPLYRQKYRAMVKEAVLLQEATFNKKEEKVNVLESLYAGADKDYQDAGRRLYHFNIQAERASKAIRILETDYATSARNFEEVLRMERQWLGYRLEQEKARTDINAAVAFINYLIGG